MSSSFDVIKHRVTPYLINTLFDSVFTVMGIVIGSVFSSNMDLRAIIGTIITASLSLGVSSGFSVYEAESLQAEKRIAAIEEALLEDLEDTVHTEASRRVTLISSILVFLTPLLAGVLTLVPFIFVYWGVISVGRAVSYAIFMDLALIFLSGYAFAVDRRLVKGLRMMILGVFVFVIGYLLNSFM